MDSKDLVYDEVDDFESEMDEYNVIENEEDLVAISQHDEVLIFNRSDGTWYSRTYNTSEIAQKVLELEKSRLE